MDKTQIEELHRNAKLANRIDNERVEAFTALLKHPGWEVYQELLNAKIQAYSDALMSPAGSVDGAVALEWVKGAMSGVILARDLPSVTIAAMTGPAPDDGEE